MKNLNKILLYAIFATIAIFVNLGAQRLVIYVTPTAKSIELPIIVGTVCGLLVKYFLDKKWIFKAYTSGASKTIRQFMLYSFLGVLTTSIFWGFEFAFWELYRTDAMREIGAIVGLSLGYFIKYQLDKKYVFIDD